jgi:hypothetical protein
MFFTPTLKGETLNIIALSKSPLGDLGAEWLFGVKSTLLFSGFR